MIRCGCDEGAALVVRTIIARLTGAGGSQEVEIEVTHCLGCGALVTTEAGLRTVYHCFEAVPPPGAPLLHLPHADCACARCQGSKFQFPRSLDKAL